MAETNGSSSDRLDRIERIEEALSTTQSRMLDHQGEVRQDITVLLRTQVIMTESFQKLTGAVEKLADGLGQLTGKMETLTERVDQLAVRVDQLAESQQDLYRAQQHTDERLDTLIKIADEWIRGQRPQ
jgi:X-X-X-Leu-X-X-Gly heptad repeat protein